MGYTTFAKIALYVGEFATGSRVQPLYRLVSGKKWEFDTVNRYLGQLLHEIGSDSWLLDFRHLDQLLLAPLTDLDSLVPFVYNYLLSFKYTALYVIECILMYIVSRLYIWNT